MHRLLHTAAIFFSKFCFSYIDIEQEDMYRSIPHRISEKIY